MNVSDTLLASVRASSLDQIRPAAISLRDAVADLTGLRCAVTDNIAVQEPMKDAAGEILAALPSVAYGFFALVIFAPLLQNHGGSLLSLAAWLIF